MNEGRWVAIGSLSAAVAVGLGAFGAHGLEGWLDAEHLNSYEVGVRYHLLHSVGLILVGLLIARWPGRAISIAGFLLFAGILLFSGGLYIWSLAQIRAVVHIVPLGGVCFLAGWVVLAFAAVGHRGSRAGANS